MGVLQKSSSGVGVLGGQDGGHGGSGWGPGGRPHMDHHRPPPGLGGHGGSTPNPDRGRWGSSMGDPPDPPSGGSGWGVMGGRWGSTPGDPQTDPPG
jgi:hypothetical protein